MPNFKKRRKLGAKLKLFCASGVTTRGKWNNTIQYNGKFALKN